MIEDICLEIEKLNATMSKNNIPFWLSVIGIFMPMILTVLVAWQSYRQDKKTNELQKQIERDSEKLQRELDIRAEKVQMRGEILKIYDAYCMAQSVYGRGKERIHILFSYVLYNNNMTDPYAFVSSLNNANSEMCNSLNRAKLIFPVTDKKIRSVLETIYTKSCELTKQFEQYLFSGEAYKTAYDASRALGAPANNQPEFMIYINNVFYSKETSDRLWKHCQTEKTKEMDKDIVEFLKLFEYGAFDVYFEPYLQMKEQE